MQNAKPTWFRVELVNVQTIMARCGYGEGRTLAQAQQDAMRKAQEQGQDAQLSDCGYEVRFAGGINC
jgi:hypothetical protein